MKIALLGDIAFFGKMSINENPSRKEDLSEIADYLKNFDYVVGNLETPFSVCKKPHGAKSAYICADIENVQLLMQLHINAVSLANNHMFDYGKEGYETTKKVLKENNVSFFGTEGLEHYIEIDGNKIAFSGFCCYTSNPLECVQYGRYGVNAYNVMKAEEIIKRNDEKGFINIVAVHAGLEHVNYPSLDHIRAARQLADSCKYVYYGHHPHVIQGVEDYNGSILAHSLGNFSFDDVYTENSKKPLVTMTENNRTGMILELTIEENIVVKWREQLIYINNNGSIDLIDGLGKTDGYNKELISCEDNIIAYNNNRNIIIQERLRERKAMRNIHWYIKRLRPRYAQIIINAKRNSKRYEKNVQCFINN